MELSDTPVPRSPHEQRLILPAHPSFRLPDSSKHQNHSQAQETLHLLHRTAKSSLLRSIPWSLLLLLQVYTEKGATGNISFLLKEPGASQLAGVTEEPSGSCQDSPEQLSSRWPPLQTVELLQRTGSCA